MFARITNIENKASMKLAACLPASKQALHVIRKIIYR